MRENDGKEARVKEAHVKTKRELEGGVVREEACRSAAAVGSDRGRGLAMALLPILQGRQRKLVKTLLLWRQQGGACQGGVHQDKGGTV